MSAAAEQGKVGQAQLGAWVPDHMLTKQQRRWRANRKAAAEIDRLHSLNAGLAAALQECATRCRYDGDLFHDQGIWGRRDASWAAARLAEIAIAKAASGTQS